MGRQDPAEPLPPSHSAAQGTDEVLAAQGEAPLAGRPMLAHLLAASTPSAPPHVWSSAAAANSRASVPAHGARRRAGAAARHRPCGRAGKPALEDFDGDVLILYCDTPLVGRGRWAMIGGLTRDAPVAVLVASHGDPRQYAESSPAPDGTIANMSIKDATTRRRGRFCASPVWRSGPVTSAAPFRVDDQNEAVERYCPNRHARCRGRASLRITKPIPLVADQQPLQLAAGALWQRRRRGRRWTTAPLVSRYVGSARTQTARHDRRAQRPLRPASASRGALIPSSPIDGGPSPPAPKWGPSPPRPAPRRRWRKGLQFLRGQESRLVRGAGNHCLYRRRRLGGGQYRAGTITCN